MGVPMDGEGLVGMATTERHGVKEQVATRGGARLMRVLEREGVAGLWTHQPWPQAHRDIELLGGGAWAARDDYAAIVQRGLEAQMGGSQ